MNALGKTVVDKTRMVSAGSTALLQGGARLSAGRYYLRVELDGKIAILAHFAVSRE
jgi:predicted component of type VI protein secretion system